MTKAEPEYSIRKMDTHWAIEYVEKDYGGEKVRVANVKNWLYKNGRNGGDTAKLFLDALETERDSGLLPRQLLAERSENMAKLAEAIQQRDALLTALERLHASCKPCPECDVEALCYTFSMVAYADAGNAIASGRTHCEERSSSGEAKTSKEGV